MKAIPNRVQKLSNYMCPTHRQDDDAVHKVEAVARSTYPSSMSWGHEEEHCRSMKSQPWRLPNEVGATKGKKWSKAKVHGTCWPKRSESPWHLLTWSEAKVHAKKVQAKRNKCQTASRVRVNESQSCRRNPKQNRESNAYQELSYNRRLRVIARKHNLNHLPTLKRENA